LTDEQKRHNSYASQVRYVVEKTFGILKRYHGLAKAKYMGIKRNQALLLTISSIAHNLKRAVSIQRASA
jgi:IS5 family transposase